jgi:hypothetical protein
VCVGKKVSGAHRDPRSRSDSVKLMIQDQEVKHPFGGKGVCVNEDVEEEKKVRHVVTRLKGHATLWWDELQA